MFNRKYVVFCLLIIALTVVVLSAMGRNFFCQCERVALWSGDINGPENSQQLVDPYSPTHVLHGLGFYGLLYLVAPQAALPLRLIAAVAVESGWEVLENSNFIINRYRAETVSYGYYGDSVLNSLSDIIMMIIGFYLASRLRVKYSILLFIMIEVALALWIRDGLLINIIMLLYPLEVLKNWQLGI